MEDCFRWQEFYTGAGEESEEEEAAETTYDELTAMPIPCSLVLLGERNKKVSEVKFNLGKREGLG